MFQAEGPVMREKTVIVTGANRGIGLETASELAKYGGRIIMACRNLDAAEEAKKEILQRLKEQPNQSDLEQRLVVKKLDLASLKSVRAFADDILKTEGRLDVLINNAGAAGWPKRTLTEDGLEMTMACNHFGHFLLTNMLLPLLKKSAPSRVVVVSSWAHTFEKRFDLENVNSEKQYYNRSVYNVTKLANILFTRQLAKRLEGTNVIANAVHPGFVDTDLFRMLPAAMRVVFRPVAFMFAKTPLKGAQTSIYLAASQAPAALVNGRYFSDMKEDRVSSVASDDALAERFWALSEKLTGLGSDK